MAEAQANKTFTDGLAFDANPVNSNFKALKDFANASVVHLDGTKDFTGSLGMGSNSIVNMGAPTADGDLATKAYADAAVIKPKSVYTVTGDTPYLSGSAYLTNCRNLVAVSEGITGVTATAGVTSTPASISFTTPGIYAITWEVDGTANSHFLGGGSIGFQYESLTWSGLGTHYNGFDSVATFPQGLKGKASNGSGFQSETIYKAYLAGTFTALSAGSISVNWRSSQTSAYDAKIVVHQLEVF